MAVTPGPQFAAASYFVDAPVYNPDSSSWSRSGGASGPGVAAGTPQEVMGSLASTGRLFQGHNEKPLGRSDSPPYRVPTTVSPRPGAEAVDIATKEGRREAAGRLGLPNVKKSERKPRKRGK